MALWLWALLLLLLFVLLFYFTYRVYKKHKHHNHSPLQSAKHAEPVISPCIVFAVVPVRHVSTPKVMVVASDEPRCILQTTNSARRWRNIEKSN